MRLNVDMIPLPAHPMPGVGPPVSIHSTPPNPVLTISSIVGSSSLSLMKFITGISGLPPRRLIVESAFGSHPI